MTRPKIAIRPASTEQLAAAVVAGGGEVVDDVTDAAGIVWVDPRDPDGLGKVLRESEAPWVQLPFAGIEQFLAAGVVDPERTWTCTKGIYGPACAEHAVALMLAAARRLHHHVGARSWRRAGLGSPERRLAGTTAVVIGTGGIGTALVPMLAPFGVRVVGVNRSGRLLPGADVTVQVERLGDIVGEADWVVVAAASTPGTRHLIGRDVLASMRDDAWIVNVARGELVDTDALVAALDAGAIGGAALDVTDPEPLPDGHPLWGRDDVIITPHVANTWDMAVPELVALIERNVAHLVAGEPLEGLVDVEAGY